MIIFISVDNLRNDFLCVHEKLQMCWPQKYIIEEVAVDSDQDVFFLELLHGGPDRQQLFLNQV